MGQAMDIDDKEVRERIRMMILVRGSSERGLIEGTRINSTTFNNQMKKKDKEIPRRYLAEIALKRGFSIDVFYGKAPDPAAIDLIKRINELWPQMAPPLPETDQGTATLEKIWAGIRTIIRFAADIPVVKDRLAAIESRMSRFEAERNSSDPYS